MADDGNSAVVLNKLDALITSVEEIKKSQGELSKSLTASLQEQAVHSHRLDEHDKDLVKLDSIEHTITELSTQVKLLMAVVGFLAVAVGGWFITSLTNLIK